MKIGKRLLSIVLCLVLVVGLLPVTALAAQQEISAVVATSQDLDSIPQLYGLLKIPEFTVTTGSPAYINSSTSNLSWEKKVGDDWINQYSGRFTPGEWRISTSLRIDGTENVINYKLNENGVTLTVNDQSWTVEAIHNSTYSFASVYSPVFTIVDDPNVQPPVPVESVDMVLNGYAPGAAAASATVTTDANVDVEVLGFLKFIDSNGDGTPDAPEEFTGNFASGEVYVVGLKIKAKPGYDISSLEFQNISLDRAVMTMPAEFDMNEECFLVTCILGDAMQYTVTFETNGGSAIQPVSVGGGGFVAEPTAPTRAYYAFAGWYSDEELTTPFYFENTPITEDTTLYAKWTPSPVNGMFLMTFDFNGGTSAMPTSGEVEANSSIYLEPNIESHVTPPSGKVFDAYEIDGVRYDAGGDYLVTENFTLKFLWKDAPQQPTTYGINCVAHNLSGNETAGTVSVQTNRGSQSGSAAFGSATEDTSVTVTATANSGYEFIGWRKSVPANAGATVSTNASYTFNATENVWLYAVFQQQPTEITSVTATVSGATAGATAGATTVTTNDSTYTVSIKNWYDCDNVFNYGSAPVLQSSDTFVGGKTYTVAVTVTPVGNTVLADASNITVEINGEDGKIGGGEGVNSRNYFITVTVPAPQQPPVVTLTDIVITTPPTKTTYTAGESFDPTGMVVTAYYSDQSSRPLRNNEYTYAPAGALTANDTEITVTYDDVGTIKTAEQAITVATSITIEIPVRKEIDSNATFSGSETFTFEVEVLNSNVEMEALAITGNSVTVTSNNGGSTTISIAVPADTIDDFYDEGIKITEKAGNAAGWTYSTEEYYVAFDASNGYTPTYSLDNPATSYVREVVFTNSYAPVGNRPPLNPPYNPAPGSTGGSFTAAKTFDGGIGLSVAVTILSAAGGAWLAKKKED